MSGQTIPGTGEAELRCGRRLATALMLGACAAPLAGLLAGLSPSPARSQTVAQSQVSPAVAAKPVAKPRR
jgi:hypothetical protein